MQKRILILGSTGSIGTSTLKVLAYQNNPTKSKISGLFANSNVNKLVEQVVQFKPEYCGLFDASYQNQLEQELRQKLGDQASQIHVICGKENINKLVASDVANVVVGAIVGFAGLESSLLALNSGKTLLLANKESLVVGGHLIKQALLNNPQAKLIPVDSEHNAIFQCLPLEVQNNVCHCDLDEVGVEKIVLTASGGPFLHLELDKFNEITPEQALKHPNWSMGAKVTIDSSTLMNKGLEFIEACVLFNCHPDKIKTIIHPQSIVHSGVEYLDKSLLVQMGPTDMCVPIAYALNYPQRDVSSVQSLDLFKLQGLTFFPVDYQRYPNFALAIESFKLGYTYTCILNAANEVTVEAFLAKKISYLDIYKFNKQTLETMQKMGFASQYFDFAKIKEIDLQARVICQNLINSSCNAK
ncbi:1-deoxy-D-xylulose-5-phosphate reductoisomerase [Psittacicella melopsittaci]|uniref:1-deoxy-D-xylulose 5-phosphate reductoisomerase n=1 Tax=Psittacicella melopsittaci TaxID=2028576 RepID=A0A3A1Y6D6_9GAMM|nr:1-deoxy-D-xylulose-5-phosphate reductoisomerase [Psittacicella melopsittaci]RIY33071.1 1-deoxy-D-xylulose-5-phosphate reductoisomerase [Psittacicella melopsittaci]